MRVSRWVRRRRDLLSRRANLKWRKPPSIVMTDPSKTSTIYYLAPHTNAPSGGVRVIYRHVDILNKLGFSAAVLHEPENVNLTWFKHSTRVESAKNLRFASNDILVLPEFYGPFLHTLPDEMAKVVFNQGAYHTFDCLDLDGTAPGAPYLGVANLRGVVTVSDDSRRLLELAFPQFRVHVTRNVLDPKVFFPSLRPRRRAIAYVPTRRQQELEQFLHILRARQLGWELMPIRGMSEQEVADTLRSVSIFLSLSELDGFGLPAAEAMACGCYVVGYHGGGGAEFFDPSYCLPVTNLADMVAGVISATQMPDSERDEFGSKASSAVLARYTEDGLRDDLETFYGSLM